MTVRTKITTTIKTANKQKKHGVKAGQKSLVRPSQKKSVKNGRHQEKDGLKKTVKVAKTVRAIPPDLDGEILDDSGTDMTVEEAEECDDNFFEEECLEPEFDDGELPSERNPHE